MSGVLPSPWEIALRRAVIDAAAERVQTGPMVGNHDADTLDMTGPQGDTRRVRLSGVDAFEEAKDGAPAQKYAAEQAQGLRDVVRDQQVRREGPQKRDTYGRTVSRLRLQDGRDLSEEMVRNGYAAVPPAFGDEDPEYRAKLEALEAEAKHLGEGMWNPLRDVDPEMPWDQRNRKFREGEKAKGHYTKEEGILDDIGGALSYVDNVARSAVDGMIDPKGTAWQYAKQAANKQRETSGGQLKDRFTKNILHMPKPLRMGKDDGKFDWSGDIGDAALDLGVELATSPTMALTLGPIAKGIGKAAAVLPRALLGAAYGAGVPGDGGFDDETSPVTRLGAAALGGLAAAYAPALSGKMAGAARAFTDGLTDQYMRFTRAAEDYSKTAKTARVGVDKAMNNASSGSMSYKTVLHSVNDGDRIALVDMINEGVTWEVGQRKAWLKLNPKAPDEAIRVAEREIKTASQARLLGNAKNMGDQFVQANKAVFVENEKMLTKLNSVRSKDQPEIVGFGSFWPDLWAAGDDVAQSFDTSFADRAIRQKQSVMRQRSEHVMAVEAFAKSGQSGLATDDAAQAIRVLGKRTQMTTDAAGKKVSMSPEVWEDLISKQPASVQKFVRGYLAGDVSIPKEFLLQGVDDTVDVYFRRYGWNTIDKASRQAIEAMADIMERKPGQGKIINTMVKDGVKTVEREVLPGSFGGYQKWENALRVWDVAQTFVVRNQLFAGLSWAKNNFWENSLKAYMSGGLAGVMDSTMFTAVRKETFGDIWRMTHGQGSSVMKSAAAEDLARAVELGVVSNPSARALGSGAKQDLQKFMYSPAGLERAEAKALEEAARHPLEKGMDRWGEMLANSVGRFGSTLENNSRFAAWVRMRDAMRKGGKIPKEMVDEMAADAVKRTFYDYSDISEFNRMVTKRIAPYASYYMKNLPYYIGAAFDVNIHGKEIVTRAMRTQMIEKAISHFGGTPSDKDKSGFNDYIRGNRPRILGKDEHGDMRIGVMPSFSRDDAFRMAGMTRPGDMAKAFGEKVNPMLKVWYELFSGNDTFTGEPLYPSMMPTKKTQDEQRKYLFGRGFLPAALGMADVDERGNPYTTSNLYAGFDKLRAAFMPMPGPEAAASVIGQAVTGKRGFGDGMFNKFLSPFQELELTKRAADMTRTLKKKDKEKNDGK